VSDQEGLRPEAEAADDATAASPEGVEGERLDGASPDDAAGAAGQEEAREPEPEPEPDFRDQYLRAMAELDNVRKRARRDVAGAEARGIGKAVKAVLPALDDLERAVAAAPEDDPMRSGVVAIQQALVSALGRLGIQPDAPKGEAFDPHRHEAIAQQPVEGAQSGTILEVYAPGYSLRGGDGDEVLLRAAKVVVAA
jgi:molecular chaperone GrpE